ncbi:MAG TPA: universal stress protein [Pseudonocardiaceae bacterium]|jgi:nucleotide-binding universal stress UspA family protein
MIPMTAGSPVVVGVDGSPDALDAARWAGQEARSQNRTLHVVHASVWSMVSHPVPHAIPAAHRQAMLERARHWVHEAANAAQAAGPGVEVVERLVVGEPAAVLIGESRHSREVVVASRGLDGPVPDLLGSTALRLAQHAGCPVIVIRNSATSNPAGAVVVGVDGSAGSDGALEFAVEFASRCGARLVALHTWSDVRLSDKDSTVWRTLDWPEVAADEERLLAERLAGWQDKYPDVEVRRVVERDRPVRCLLHAAVGARMLVIGSRGRGGVPGTLLGSTSQSLLHVTPCPLAVIRH